MSKYRHDSGYQTALLIAFMATYVVLAGILGGIDTLTNHGDNVGGGSDRIVNSESDLLYVLSPLVIVGAVLLLLHIRDRTDIED